MQRARQLPALRAVRAVLLQVPQRLWGRRVRAAEAQPDQGAGECGDRGRGVRRGLGGLEWFGRLGEGPNCGLHWLERRGGWYHGGMTWVLATRFFFFCDFLVGQHVALVKPKIPLELC